MRVRRNQLDLFCRSKTEDCLEAGNTVFKFMLSERVFVVNSI